MRYDYEHLNCEDGSFANGDVGVYGPEPVMIRDKIYSFQTIYGGSTPSHVFIERDKEGRAVRDVSLEIEGIQYGTMASTEGLYSNSKDVYFIGQKERIPYLYRFDGETFIQMERVPINYDYEELCVTDSALRIYKSGCIIEVSLQ